MKKLFNTIPMMSLIILFFVSETVSAQTKINSSDDLPKRTYDIGTSINDFLNNEALFTKVTEQLKADVRSDLAHFIIEDKATLTDLHYIFMHLALLENNPNKIIPEVQVIRGLQDKAADRAHNGIFAEAFARTLEKETDTQSDSFKSLLQKELTGLYNQIDFEIIREKVESSKGQMEIISSALMENAINNQLQPIIDNTKGMVGQDILASIIGVKTTMDTRIPYKNELLAVYTELLEANKSDVVKIDIWKDRDVTLTEQQKLSKTVIGIWDSGVDMAVFEKLGIAFTNSNERMNGTDDDSNGFVDDVNGIAFDVDKKKTSTGTLLDVENMDLTYPINEMQNYIKGFLDLQSAIDSKEASDLKMKLGSLSADEMNPFLKELGIYGAYSHGTHVAGIAAAGNPSAEILPARMSFDHNTIPAAPTVESAKRTAEMYKETVKYFKANGVKLVNMSWRYSKGAYESMLEINGVGADAQERSKMAQEIFDIEKEALYNAIKNAPEILFVAGAGNENNDANFEQYIPASLELPNLITVGAVDQEGKRTSFTSEGKSVVLYANGYEIESYVPGGDRMNFSGTSMASPQVANLAGKILALNPALSPEEVIAHMKKGATLSEEGLPMIHALQTLELVK